MTKLNLYNTIIEKLYIVDDEHPENQKDISTICSLIKSVSENKLPCESINLYTFLCNYCMKLGIALAISEFAKICKLSDDDFNLFHHLTTESNWDIQCYESEVTKAKIDASYNKYFN